MILSPETLLNFLDLVESGASTAEASSACGAAPKSKIAFKWISDSRDMGEFGATPDAASPWCIEWGGSLDWFHLHYETARADGRINRTMRAPRETRPVMVTPLQQDLRERISARQDGRAAAVSPSLAERNPAPPLAATPLRVELEERLRIKREEQTGQPPGPRLVVDHYQSAPVRIIAPPKSPTNYARRAKPLDDVHDDNGPPPEGRFLVSADRPKSLRERMAGTTEITDLGIRKW